MRPVRKIVVGRKAWMFYSTDTHAEAAAAIFSIIATCRLHGIDPFVYFDEVLRVLPMNLSMSRSHAWVQRGEELIDRVPMNKGTNLIMLGAIRLTGWVVLTSMFATETKDRFVAWVKHKLLPKLRYGDVVVIDNLRAHHDPRVGPACDARGVRVIDLPPYSPDFNPIVFEQPETKRPNAIIPKRPKPI